MTTITEKGRSDTPPEQTPEQKQTPEPQAEKDSEIRAYLTGLISSVSTENPLEYFHTLYDSVNPIMIKNALAASRDLLKKSNQKQGRETKDANCFLCIGGDNINEMFIQGIIAALLWLPKYIDDATEVFQISRDDVETVKKVLTKINLPRVFDAHDYIKQNEDGTKETIKIKPSNLRHYASFLTAIIKWATTTCTDFRQETPRSNLELVRYLAATAMNSFPSIPFSSYYVGTVKTNDYMKLTEKLNKSIKFDEYMSSLSLHINQPRFIVSINDAPLVGVSGHPLSPLLVGMYSPDTDTAEWLGIYAQNNEFERLCTEAGFSTDEIRNYVLGTTLEKHKQILTTPAAKFHGIAQFIEKHELLKFGLEKYHSYERSSNYDF